MWGAGHRLQGPLIRPVCSEAPGRGQGRSEALEEGWGGGPCPGLQGLGWGPSDQGSVGGSAALSSADVGRSWGAEVAGRGEGASTEAVGVGSQSQEQSLSQSVCAWPFSWWVTAVGVGEHTHTHACTQEHTHVRGTCADTQGTYMRAHHAHANSAREHTGARTHTSTCTQTCARPTRAHHMPSQLC